MCRIYIYIYVFIFIYTRQSIRARVFCFIWFPLIATIPPSLRQLDFLDRTYIEARILRIVVVVVVVVHEFISALFRRVSKILWSSRFNSRLDIVSIEISKLKSCVVCLSFTGFNYALWYQADIITRNLKIFSQKEKMTRRRGEIKGFWYLLWQF